MKTYIFHIEIEQEEDGRWSAEVPSLPGCATWGYTNEEALTQHPRSYPTLH
jgi:predicted RNase H-like HicB family nuclease